MGAVFAIFLLVPLFLPVFFVNLMIEQITGVPTSEQYELLSQAFETWAVENPEAVAGIGESLKEAFNVVMNAAEIANSIFIS